MDRVLDLINQKNHYLEQFYSLNEQELVNFEVGNFDNIEYFYESRNGILQNISYIDQQIEICLSNQETTSNDSSGLSFIEDTKKDMAQALNAKEEYVRRILEQDLKILSCIENTKSSIIRELQDIQRSRKAVGGYKSPTFEKILDEEV